MAIVTVQDGVNAAVHVDQLSVGEAGIAVDGAGATSGDILLKIAGGKGVNLTNGQVFDNTSEIFIVKYSPGARITIEIT